MTGIRHKLLLGFGGLLLIVAAMGLLTIRQIDSLGGAIDVILKQNYRSVIACQEMTESIDHMDSGVLFTFAGHYAEGMANIRRHEQDFRNALDVELGNITLPGEHQKAIQIRALFTKYTIIITQVTDHSVSLTERQKQYFSDLLPLFHRIKLLSGEILEMNQSNMHQANNNAWKMASSAHNNVLAAIIASAVIALLFSYQSHRWILMPIKKLIVSAEEIRKGNLDLVLDTTSNDEIGQLSESFNEMTATLRKMRKSDREDLFRTRKATQEVFKILPSPIAVLDLNGVIEVSTETAEHYFGLKPGVNVCDLGHEWLTTLWQKAHRQGCITESEEGDGFIQHFVGSEEHFFQLMAAPVPAGTENDEFAGTALIFRDVTQVHEQLELKRSVISTVSHQLRTPLTSLRMSIHLLLEERIGQLNEKQTDLLLAAREESERLVHIIDDLLDLNRIESGKAHLNLQAISPSRIGSEGIEPFLAQARDQRVSIVNSIPEDLPDVIADSDGIRYVLANLLSNALRFTSPGGTVTVSAANNSKKITFSVEDTGAGISPEHIKHLFEQFYRVPGQQVKSGVGLGLSIVKEIIEAHGGKTGVESTCGKGSTFHFSLPLQKETT
jgi:NtrC-family two-component system sensor histidine kinase KinB